MHRSTWLRFFIAIVSVGGSNCDRHPSNPSLPSHGPTYDTNHVQWVFDIPCSQPNSVGAVTATAVAAPLFSAMVTSPGDSGAGTLRNLLGKAKAGDTIGIDAALAGDTIHLAQELSITRSVTIDASSAPGITIDGGNAVRIFSVSADQSFSISGIGMINGRAVGTSGWEPGGAISTGNHCVLQIDNCVFVNNVADCGGAVRAGYETFTTVENCTFDNNDGSGADNGFSAGAISTYGHGELVVRHCNFVNNRGNSGAAVYNLLQPITIEDCTFTGNISNNDGAAIFTDEGNWVGPSATTGGHIFVRRCWMEGNKSKAFGGACMLWANRLDTVMVENCVFKENQVDKGGQWGDSKGGAIRGNGILTIRNCSFIRNQAQVQGGALWLDGEGPFEIVNSTFYGNTVVDDQGGAMTLNINGPLAIRNCTIVGNKAGRACGAFWFRDPDLPITVINSVVAFNTAGQEHDQDQIGYQPIDGGGNIEYPLPANWGKKVAQGSRVTDPMIDSLTQDKGMLVIPLKRGSPAIDSAIAAKAPVDDICQKWRDIHPDCGAWEYVESATSVLCP